MLISIGNDLVQINRVRQTISRFGQQFLDRVFTKSEQNQAGTRHDSASYYAKRFAAKEAMAKALGTGIGKNALFNEIEILNEHSGKPIISLSGAADRRLHQMLPQGMRAHIHVSLSDEVDLAQAFVVVEALPNTGTPDETTMPETHNTDRRK